MVEDHKNPNLLFAGTEFSAYVSIDGGANWRRLNGLPTVPVHDLVIHPREADLIAATHGRSLWILDDITPLQQLTPAVQDSDLHLFKNKVATIWTAVSRGATRGALMFQGRNPLTIAQRPPANSPTELQNSAAVSFYLKNAPTGQVQIEISSMDGARTFTANIQGTAGINRYFWPLRFGAAGGGPGGGGGGGRRGGGAGGGAAAGAGGGGGGGRAAAAGAPPDPDAPPPQAAAGGANVAAPGTYRVKITANGKSATTTLTVRADPGIEK